MPLEPNAHKDLRNAVELLEKTRFIARLTHYAGQPIEKMIDTLPAGVSDRLQGVVRATVTRLLGMALKTLDARPRSASPRIHKVAGGLSGAIGGAFGVTALAVELPLSTAIMLRAIADIARSEGEDLTTVESRLACLEVFALGGRSTADDGADTGYYAVRATLAKALSEAAQHIASKGLTDKGAPVLVRFIAQISSRFGALVSEKVAAQAVPVIGAVGGAGINLLFLDHFQETARGHFIVRRLERAYGKNVVQQAYRELVTRERGFEP
jgi:EcsC protein family